MTRIMLAGLLVGLLVTPGRSAAVEAAGKPITVHGGAGLRFTDLDTSENKGQVLEYDGAIYRVGRGDAWLSGEANWGLFDFQIKDIGSHEESGSLNIDYKSLFKGSAKVSQVSHRQNLMRTGVVVNGVWQPDPYLILDDQPRYDGVYYFNRGIFRRTETEANLGVFDPENSARWITGQYWSVRKKGDQTWRYNAHENMAFVDNTKTDYTVSLGKELGHEGQLSLDYIRTDFEDTRVATYVVFPPGNETKPRLPSQSMNAAETRFRYNVSKALAVTGAVTGRQRENMINQYKMNAVVGALNAAYQATSKLSLTAKLYTRGVWIDENPDFRLFNTRAQGDTHELDKNTLRGELKATYELCKAAKVKAGYKVELNHRRDAPSELFSGTVEYDNGTTYSNTQANSVAGEDTKRTATLGLDAELPLGITAQADYRNMRANRAAFENQPHHADEVGGTLQVPLPAHVDLVLAAGYLTERNTRSTLTKYSQSRNTYRAGLDWAAANKVFLGVDATYEKIKYFVDGYFGAASGVAGNDPIPGTKPLVPGMNNRQRHTTVGVHGRLNVTKDVAFLTDNSYTWAVVQTPVNIPQTTLQPTGTATPPGTNVGDVNLNDTRITRVGVAFEYTPVNYSYLTARAGYRVQRWLDKTDPQNSGRASITEVGASVKF